VTGIVPTVAHVFRLGNKVSPAGAPAAPAAPAAAAAAAAVVALPPPK